jgi:hypothetical protein
MRRLLFAAAALAAACAGPRPCTQALCPLPPYEGTYSVRGWTKSVTVSPGVPAIPIVSDATVDIVRGEVAFRNGGATVYAEAGASFTFAVSSGSVAVPSLLVSTGEVFVSVSSGAPRMAVEPDALYFLPVAKK